MTEAIGNLIGYAVFWILFVLFVVRLFAESWGQYFCWLSDHKFEPRYNSAGMLRENYCTRCGETIYHYPPYEDFED